MTGKKVLLERDISKALKNLPKGSRSFQMTQRYLLKALVKDLIAINKLVPKLSILSNGHIYALIDYWQSKGNTKKTMQRKISLLRKIITRGAYCESFPSNIELGIRYQYKKTVQQVTSTPDNINAKIIRAICQVQYHFGLKKIEAIRFRPFFFKESSLLLPRSITYNRKTRFIPVDKQIQYDCIEHIRQQYKDGFIADNRSEKFLSGLYDSELTAIGIKDGDYFRYWYIKNRYQQLETIPVKKRLQLLRKELGYQTNRQLKEILKCLNVF